MAKIATGGKQKTLAGLDDVAYENGNLNFKAMKKLLALMLPAASSFLTSTLVLVNKVSHFMSSTKYKTDHLCPTSRVAAHCTNLAFNLQSAKPPLSKFSSPSCGPECHSHDSFCSECDEIQELVTSLKVALRTYAESGLYDADRVEDMQFLVDKCIHKLDIYLGHIVRGKHESSCFDERLTHLPYGTVFIGADYKMKVLPKYYRESQVMFFGQKGQPLLGVIFMFLLNKDDKELTTRMYLITGDDATQDCFATLAYMEQAIIHFTTEFPHIFRAVNYTDGGAAFSGSEMRMGLPLLFAKYGIFIDTAVTGEAGFGKWIIDALFAVVNSCILRFVVQHQGAGDVDSPASLTRALIATLGDKAVIFNVSVDRSLACDGFKASIFGGIIGSVSAVSYVDFVIDPDTDEIISWTTVLRQHSKTGVGMSFSAADIALGWIGEEQSFPIGKLVLADVPGSLNYTSVPNRPGIWGTLTAPETKEEIRQQLVMKREAVLVRKQEKLLTFKRERYDLAVKNKNCYTCPIERCTRLFISQRGYKEHMESMRHTDGSNYFRVGPDITRSAISTEDYTRQQAITILAGGDSALVQRYSYHLDSASAAPMQFTEEDVRGDHFIPNPGFGQQISEPHFRRDYSVIAFLFHIYDQGNQNKLHLATAEQVAANMHLFGTLEGEQAFPGNPVWLARPDLRPVFRVSQLLQARVIKTYFGKNANVFRNQFLRAEAKEQQQQQQQPPPQPQQQPPQQQLQQQLQQHQPQQQEVPSDEESLLGDEDDALAELVRARGGDTNEAAPEDPDANLAGALSLMSSSNSGKQKSAISLLQMGFSAAKPSDYGVSRFATTFDTSGAKRARFANTRFSND